MTKRTHPIILLHGTSLRSFEGIRRKGLKNPYLTDLDYMAEAFSDEAAQHDKSTPIVLEVLVREPDHLRVDRKMWEAPIEDVIELYDFDGYGEWAKAIKEGRITIPKHASDWKTSLQFIHSVWHDGVILPEDIQIYWQGTDSY